MNEKLKTLMILILFIVGCFAVNAGTMRIQSTDSNAYLDYDDNGNLILNDGTADRIVIGNGIINASLSTNGLSVYVGSNQSWDVRDENGNAITEAVDVGGGGRFDVFGDVVSNAGGSDKLRISGSDAEIDYSQSDEDLNIIINNTQALVIRDDDYNILFEVVDTGTVGESFLSGVTAGAGDGQVVCVKADGYLGTCTDAINASGLCTCT